MATIKIEADGIGTTTYDGDDIDQGTIERWARQAQLHGVRVRVTAPDCPHGLPLQATDAERAAWELAERLARRIDETRAEYARTALPGTRP